MTAAAKELVELVSQLPEEKAREVVDFARFLKHQASDMAWERIIDDPHARPRLEMRSWRMLCAKGHQKRLIRTSCDLQSPAFLLVRL